MWVCVGLFAAALWRGASFLLQTGCLSASKQWTTASTCSTLCSAVYVTVRVYATVRATLFGPLLSFYILSNIILNPSSRPPPPRCVHLKPFPVFNPDHSSHVPLFTHQHQNNLFICIGGRSSATRVATSKAKLLIILIICLKRLCYG